LLLLFTLISTLYIYTTGMLHLKILECKADKQQILCIFHTQCATDCVWYTAFLPNTIQNCFAYACHICFIQHWSKYDVRRFAYRSYFDVL